MTPDIGIHIKVGRMILAVIRIIPEIDWHRGKRRQTHQLALLVNNRVALLIECLHVHTESPALQFTGINRTHGIAQGKASI